MVDSSDQDKSAGDRSRRERQRSDFQASVDRLEKAIQDLVGTATNEFSGRAAGLIDEITAKLRLEIDDGSDEQRENSGHERRHTRSRSGSDEAGRTPVSRMRARRMARREAWRDRMRVRSSRLYRDPARAKIGGVCAGIASYYGVESWVVRCIACTGLVFLPTIVFPAYWIAYFVMERKPREGSERARRARTDDSSPSPELGPNFSPRRSLRNIQSDFTEVELRLRRMESHVTSGQFELQRELNRIENGAPATDPELGVAR